MEVFGKMCVSMLLLAAFFLLYAAFVVLLNNYQLNEAKWICSKYRVVAEGNPVREECIQYSRRDQK